MTVLMPETKMPFVFGKMPFAFGRTFFPDRILFVKISIFAGDG
jgi:hypothetical protein